MATSWKVLFLLALALALGSIAYTLLGPKGSDKQDQLQDELERLRQDNLALAEDNRRLSLEVEALKHRKDYIEKVARDDLGLVRSDEVVFHLPTRPVTDESGEAPDAGVGGDNRSLPRRP